MYENRTIIANNLLHTTYTMKKFLMDLFSLNAYKNGYTTGSGSYVSKADYFYSSNIH